MVMSVANHKGGVGKTTTALTLGHALALLDKRVLLIDLDPQMNLSQTLERSNWDKLVNIHYALRDGEIPLSSLIQNTRIPNLDIVPSSEFLRAADVEEEQQWLESEKARLGEAGLNRLRNQALSRCGLAYQSARSEEVRGAILEGELNAMLLEQRENDM